jgi:hypothetical protein
VRPFRLETRARHARRLVVAKMKKPEKGKNSLDRTKGGGSTFSHCSQWRLPSR